MRGNKGYFADLQAIKVHITKRYKNPANPGFLDHFGIWEKKE